MGGGIRGRKERVRIGVSSLEWRGRIIPNVLEGSLDVFRNGWRLREMIADRLVAVFVGGVCDGNRNSVAAGVVIGTLSTDAADAALFGIDAVRCPIDVAVWAVEVHDLIVLHHECISIVLRLCTQTAREQGC